MRAVILLVLTVVALAILRMLVNDVTRAATKAFSAGDGKKQAAQSGEESAGPRSAGRLVRDPHTGAYVDEASAVKERIGEQLFFFESAESRDAYLRERRA
jgi:hypothetical protein